MGELSVGADPKDPDSATTGVKMVIRKAIQGSRGTKRKLSCGRLKESNNGFSQTWWRNRSVRSAMSGFGVGCHSVQRGAVVKFWKQFISFWNSFVVFAIIKGF